MKDYSIQYYKSGFFSVLLGKDGGQYITLSGDSVGDVTYKFYRLFNNNSYKIFTIDEIKQKDTLTYPR